jgi:DNA-binding transcriptional ArsR family regulator
MESAEAALLALSDRNRLKLLRLLLAQPFSVSELTRISGLGQSLVSHHLSVLARNGWIEGQRDGRRRIYHAGSSFNALAPLAQWIKRQIALPDHWRQSDLEAVTTGGRGGDQDLEDYLL